MNPLLKGLRYVVQVRYDGPYTPWNTIAAFDCESSAEDYVAGIRERTRGCEEYAVVSL